MDKPRLTYFDIPTSRGEECRLALFLAGIDFEDRRLERARWLELKSTMPYGAMPVLEIPDRPPLAHTNAILAYIGRQHDLHPKDLFEAARHEGVMNHVEDLRAQLSATSRISDPEARRAAREALASGYLPSWAGYAERQIHGPFVGGDVLQVADLKLFVTVAAYAGGGIEHVPTDVFADFRKLMTVHDAVRAHPRVSAWYAR